MDSSMLDLNPPEEQRREIQADKAEFLAAAPLMKSLLLWFDEEIKLCDTLDGISLEMDSIEIKAQVLARQLLKAKLEMAKSNLEARKAAFQPNYKQ